MKVLVVGNGGREHTLVWKIAQSPKVSKIFCAPGNGGTEELAVNVDISTTDYKGILDFVTKEEIDLTVVGPEVPLCGGLVDLLEDEGFKVFGPRAKAAMIEGSKTFSKDFMEKYNIPTAKYVACNKLEDANKALETFDLPVVIKADGLAAGKGVSIIETYQEGRDVLKGLMDEGNLGEAGTRVVIEEFLIGEEVSLLAFSDGKSIIPMVSAQDHKTIFDGDKGPNTGGMGTYSPAPIYTPEIHKIVMENIMIPTVKGMKDEGRLFKGVLYSPG